MPPTLHGAGPVSEQAHAAPLPFVGRICLILIPVLLLAACAPRASAPMPTGTIRERLAVLALRQPDFGSISLLPVRFEHGRLAGPFEDGGRILYCVSSQMKGRSLGKAERPKVVIRDEGGVLKVVEDDEEICQGHRTVPFPELETLGNGAG